MDTKKVREEVENERKGKRTCLGPDPNFNRFVQVCPALALAVFSKYTSAEAHNLIPGWLLEPNRFQALEPECPTEVVHKLEDWLQESGCCVLHRAWSREHALSTLAQVTRVWQSADLGHKMSELCRFGAALCCGRCYPLIIC